jgi:hypothetical protein
VLSGMEEGEYIEQRWYAHRKLRSLLVHEIEYIGPSGSQVTLDLSLNAGNKSGDFDFTTVISNETMSLIAGNILLTETEVK